MAVEVERRLVRWGHGYGIRLTKEEARKIGAREGTKVRAKVEGEDIVNDVAKMTLFRFRPGYDIQELIDEDLSESTDGERS